MRSSEQAPGLKRFFAGLTEYTFQTQLGVADPPLTDYLTDLLVRFLRCDAIFFSQVTGRPLRHVVDMLLEAQQIAGEAQRELHRHIGDFTLFWSGIYPEALRRLRAAHSADALLDYRAQGRRAYLIASRIEPEEEASAPSEVLQRLGRDYDLVAFGLREVRREWERRDAPDFPRPTWLN